MKERSEYIPARITGLQRDGYSKPEIMSVLGLSSSTWFEIQPLYQALKNSMKSDRRKGSAIYSRETSELFMIYEKSVEILEKSEHQFAATCCIGG